MYPVLYDHNLSTDPSASDSIKVELWSPANLSIPAYSAKTILHDDGHASILFPSGVFGNSFYIVLRYRNAIQTWSKNAVLFNNTSVSFDFTSPE